MGYFYLQFYVFHPHFHFPNRLLKVFRLSRAFQLHQSEKIIKFYKSKKYSFRGKNSKEKCSFGVLLLFLRNHVRNYHIISISLPLKFLKSYILGNFSLGSNFLGRITFNYDILINRSLPNPVIPSFVLDNHKVTLYIFLFAQFSVFQH